MNLSLLNIVSTFSARIVSVGYVRIWYDDFGSNMQSKFRSMGKGVITSPVVTSIEIGTMIES